MDMQKWRVWTTRRVTWLSLRQLCELREVLSRASGLITPLVTREDVMGQTKSTNWVAFKLKVWNSVLYKPHAKIACLYVCILHIQWRLIIFRTFWPKVPYLIYLNLHCSSYSTSIYSNAEFFCLSRYYGELKKKKNNKKSISKFS